MERLGERRPSHLPVGDSPPAEALAAVSVAAARAKQLARADRQLHFELDERSGRIMVELRTLDGAFIGTLTGAEALAALTDPPL